MEASEIFVGYISLDRVAPRPSRGDLRNSSAEQSFSWRKWAGECGASSVWALARNRDGGVCGGGSCSIRKKIA